MAHPRLPITFAQESPNAAGLYSSSQAICGRTYRFLGPSSESRASRASFVSVTGHLVGMRCVDFGKRRFKAADGSRPAAIDGDDLRQDVADGNGGIVTGAGVAARHDSPVPIGDVL